MDTVTFEAIDDLCVLMHTTDETGHVQTREFYAPDPYRGSTYVHELVTTSYRPQVCRYLNREGATLHFHKGEKLIDVIRAEHRRGVAAAAAAERRMTRAMSSW